MIIMRPRAVDYIAPPGFCPLHDTLRNEPPKMSEPVLYLLSVATSVNVYEITDANVYPSFSRIMNIVELSLKNIYSPLIQTSVWGGNANSSKIDIRNDIDDSRINEVVRYKNIKHTLDLIKHSNRNGSYYKYNIRLYHYVSNKYNSLILAHFISEII